MATRPRILLLGGNGYLGPPVVRELERDCDLRVTDVVPVSGPHGTIQVDAGDYRQVRAAAEGTDAIINCPVSRRDRRGAFDVNTRGTWNALRAAVEAGHRRFVNTGPRFTLAGRRYLDLGLRHRRGDSTRTPGTGLYALSKSLGQEICRLFSEQHPIHVLTLIFSQVLRAAPRGRAASPDEPVRRHLPGRGRRGPLRPRGRSRSACRRSARRSSSPRTCRRTRCGPARPGAFSGGSRGTAWSSTGGISGAAEVGWPNSAGSVRHCLTIRRFHTSLKHDRKHSPQGPSELLDKGANEGSEGRVDSEAATDHVGSRSGGATRADELSRIVLSSPEGRPDGALLRSPDGQCACHLRLGR